MPSNNQIRFGVGFDVDKAGIDSLKKQLQDLQNLTAKDITPKVGTSAVDQLKRVKTTAQEVQRALQNAFNSDLGTVNISKFNDLLKNLGIDRIAQDFSSAGLAGEQAFNSIAAQALTLNTNLKQTYSFLDKIQTTLGNTIKWNLASSAVNGVTNSIRDAFNYTKALDTSLTNIRIVTGDSRNEMAQFAVEANKAAQALGRQTKDYTNAALAFYQQGLGDEEVKARTEATLMAQNVTGAGAEMADYLTAVWNGFQINTENTVNAVDKLAAVADSSASNLSELAVAMSKSSSIANTMGVDIDQLAAQISTIIATTRQAPETVGNALKTIYARINDIKTGSDDAEVSLGNYTGKMAALGFSVLDAEGNLRDTGEVIEEIGNSWSNLSREQQIYLAQTMAGQRQLNNLIALFDNWDQYIDMVNVSMNSEGSLMEKNERYMESYTAGVNRFRASLEGLQDALISEDGMRDFYDFGANILNLLTDFVNGIGGAKGALVGFATILTTVFQKEIASSVATAVSNIRLAKEEASGLAQQKEILQLLGLSSQSLSNPALKSSIDSLTELRQGFERYSDILTQTDKVAINSFIKQRAEINNNNLAYKELLDTSTEVYKGFVQYDQKQGENSYGLTKAISAPYQENQTTGLIELTNKEDVIALAETYEYITATLTSLNDTVKSFTPLDLKEIFKVDPTTTPTIEELEKEIENLKSQLSTSTDSAFIQKTQEDIKKLEQTINSLQGREQLQAYIKEIQELISTGTVIDDNKAKLERLINVINSTSTTSAAKAQAFVNLREALAKMAQQGEISTDQLYKLDAVMQQNSDQADILSERIKNLQDVLADKEFGKGVSQIVSGISQFSMAITAFSGVSKTLKEVNKGNITTLEAFPRLLSGMTMGITSSMRAITNLREGFQKITPVVSAFITNAGGIGSALLSVGAAIGPWLALAAAIGAVYLAFTKADREAKKAKEAAEEMRQEAEELNQKYSELKQNIESYQNAVKALETLTENTQEWKDKVDDLTIAYRNLIKEFPQLSAALVDPEDITKGFDPEKIEQFLNEQRQTANAADYQAYRSGVNASDKTNDVAIDRATRQVQRSSNDIVYDFEIKKVLDLYRKHQDLFNLDVESFKEITQIASDSTAQSMLANQELFDNLLKKIEDTSTSDTDKVYAQDFLETGVGSTTWSGLSDAQRAAATRSMAQELGQAKTEEEIQAVIDNTQKFYDAVANTTDEIALEFINNEAPNLAKFTRTEITKALNDAEFGRWTTEQVQALQTQFNQLNQPYNSSEYGRVNAVVQDYTERQGIDNITSSDQGFIQEVLEKSLSGSRGTFEAIGNIFGQSNLDGEKFIATLRELSGQTEVTKSDIEKVVEDFNLTKEAVEPLLEVFGTNLPQDMGTLTQRFQDIESATKGIKDGDIVSAKDIEQMQALGLDTDRFFAIGADGAGRLRTSAEEFYEYVNNQSLEGFKEQIESLREEVRNREHLTDKFDSAQDIVDTGTSTEKLEYLDYSGYDANFIENARAEFADTGKLSAETINQINEAILNLGDEGLNKLSEGTAEVVEEVDKLQNAVAITEADSIEDVNKSFMAGDLSYEDYGATLETASTKEFEGLNLDPDEVKEYADAIQEAADDSEDLADSLEADRAEALKLAREYARLNRGIEDLAKNYDDWTEALESGDTLEQAEAARELKEAVADIADIDASNLSEDFLQNADNLELMKGAADGDAEAIDNLRAAVAEDIIIHAALDSGADAELQAELLEMQANAQATLAAQDLEIGASLDNSQVLEALTEIINQSGMTAQQASDYLSSMGVDAEVEPATVTEKFTHSYPLLNITHTEDGYPILAPGPVMTLTDEHSGVVGSALKISNAKWGGTSGGNIKKGNKGGYSGGKKGGGGGGGGGKTPKKQKAEDPIDKRDNEPDLYHDINIQIRDLEHSFNKLSKEQDKLVGKGLVGNLRQQADMLRQQKGLLEEKAKIQEKDLAQQKEELAALGVTFDTYGNITNYMDVMVQYQEELNRLADIYNDIVAQYNAASPEEQEALKERLDAAKEDYELAKKKRDQQEEYIKKYDDTMADWQQNQEDMIEKENEAIEKLIEAFNKEIEVRLDVKQAELDFNEFRRKVLDQIKDDDYLGLATANIGKFDTYYRDTEDGIIQELTDHVNEIMEEADEIYGGGYSETYGDNMAAALEDLKNYNDELMSSLEEVRDLVEEIHDNYLDMIDKAQEEFDTQKDIYGQIDDTIEHDLSLLELLQGEDNYADRNQYLDKQVQNYYDQMDLLRREKDMWWALMQGAKRGTEEWKKFRDNWLQAVSDFNSAIEASVEKMFEKYQNMIQTIIKDARDQAYGGDMQQALNQWDDLLWNNDRYLDMPSRATGVLKFINDANKAMDGLDAKAQKDINTLMDSEVDRLNNIKNLRQIDLDIANKRLEVLQKQIALEDAQNNKTKMRLRRDSQGNYTYQYVADEDNIAEKQAELNQSLEELRQLSKNDLTETVSAMSERLQEYFDQAQELNDTYYYDQELLNEKLAELHDRYFNPETGIMSKMNLDYQTMQAVLLQDTGAQFAELLKQQGDALAAFLGLDTTNAADNSVWQAVQQMIAPDGKIPSLLDSFTTDIYKGNLDKMSEDMRNMLFAESGIQPSWNSAIGNMVADFTDSLVPTIEESMDKMVDANQEYMDDLDELQSVAQVSFDNVADGIDMDIEHTQELLEANDDLVNSYWDQVEATGAAYDSIRDLCDAYSDAADAAKEAAEAAYEYWRAVNLDFDEDELDDEFDKRQQMGGDILWEDRDPNEGVWDWYGNKQGTTLNGVHEARLSSQYNDIFGNFAFENNKLLADSVHNVNNGLYGLQGQAWRVVNGEKVYLSDDELQKLGIKQYAEGGYTGDWASGQGQLAAVHSGEYVLTERDVPNLFNAVNIANSILNKVANMGSSLFSAMMPGFNTTPNNNSLLDQNVTIYAEFKDATSADQIKVAFRDLINEASQRVSQNRRVQ